MAATAVMALLVTGVALVTLPVGSLPSWLTSLPPEDLIGGIAMVTGAVCAMVVVGSLERGLFLLFVLVLPVRAALRFGTIPSDVDQLMAHWNVVTGNAGWIGYPLGTLSVSPSDILLALLWLRAFPELLRNRWAFPWRAFGGAALLVFAEVISILAASQRTLAWWAAVETVKAVLGAAYVVYRTRSRLDLEFCFNALSIAVVLQAGIVVAQFVTSSTLGVTFSGVEWASTLEGGAYVRGSGTFAHPQMLAMYIGVFLPLLVALTLRPQPFRVWVFRGAVAVSGSVAFILTFSRIGWLAVGITLPAVVATFVFSRTHGHFRARAAVFLCLLLIAAVPTWPLIQRNLTIDRIGSDLDIAGDLYRTALKMILSRPLAGVGIDNFSFVMPIYDETGISSSYPAPVHNLFVLALAETGPLGLAGLLGAIGAPAIALWRTRRRLGLDDEGQHYVTGLLGGLLVFFVLSLTGWTYYTIQPQVWCFLGTALATVSVLRTAPIGRQVRSSARHRRTELAVPNIQWQ